MTNIRAWVLVNEGDSGLECLKECEVGCVFYQKDYTANIAASYKSRPKQVIIDTPEGREAFARECFEAAREIEETLLAPDSLQFNDRYETADDFIAKLKEKGKL